MAHRHALLVAGVLLTILAACTSVTDQEIPQSAADILALTPTATLSPTATATATNTPPPTATTGPTPTPTNTPIPTATPFPPTPTPNPALAEFSHCVQTAGDTTAGRFSAQLTGISSEDTPLIERLTFSFTQPEAAAAIHGVANCLSGADFAAREGLLDAPGAYVLALNLDDWLHDASFSASPLTQTVELTRTTIASAVSYQVAQNADSGAVVAVTLKEPVPYRVRSASNPPRLIVEIAKTAAAGIASDPLIQPLSGAARPTAPLFFIQGGDIYRFANGSAQNLTDSAAAETSFALSPDGSTLAFCRALGGFSDDDYGTPGEIVVMDAEGKQEQILSPARSCADPAFSPDGNRLAWTLDEAGAPPSVRAIWTIDVEGASTPQRITPGGDEWERFAPRWLDEQTLIYLGRAIDGRSALFRLDTGQDGKGASEEDISSSFIVGERYSAVGTPLVSPDGERIAVEAMRADAAGAALLILDADGAVQQEIGEAYWNRPLAWSEDGELYYLTTACASTLVQSYELRRLRGSDDQVLTAGSSLVDLGNLTTSGSSGLAYVIYEIPQAGLRGGLRPPAQGASTLWFWNTDAGRAELYNADSALSGLR